LGKTLRSRYVGRNGDQLATASGPAAIWRLNARIKFID
jgi:hypothetical protein